MSVENISDTLKSYVSENVSCLSP